MEDCKIQIAARDLYAAYNHRGNAAERSQAPLRKDGDMERSYLLWKWQIASEAYYETCREYRDGLTTMDEVNRAREKARLLWQELYFSQED